MLAVSYALNGIPLDGPAFRVVVGSTWFAGVSPRRNVVAMPGRHGSLRTGVTPRFDERETVIKTISFGDATEQSIARFLQICTLPSLTLSKTERSPSGMQRMSTRVELTSLEPDGDERPYSRRGAYTAVFAMPDVWWESDDHLIRSLPSNGGMMLPAPQRFTANAEDPGYRTMWLGEPDDSISMLFDRVTPAMFGDAPITNPIIRVVDATGVRVTDPSSGTTLMWSGTIPASRPYLYLDPANLTAWTSASTTAWDAGVRTGEIDYEGEPLEIWPGTDGSYRLEITQTGGEGNVAVRFRPAWW